MSATANLHFRLDRDIATGTITSYYSLDGSAWTLVGSIVQSLNNPRLAIVVDGDESPGGYPNADIAWAEIITSSSTKSTSNEISPQKAALESPDQSYKQANILHQNYPNPFNNSTWIEYDLAEDGYVTLEIFNSFGQKIETVLSQYMRSGNYKFIWDSRNYPSGIYYLTMKSGIFISSIKLSLLK